MPHALGDDVEHPAKKDAWFWPKITPAITAKHPWLVKPPSREPPEGRDKAMVDFLYGFT
jgi:hypothetical protein